MRKVMVGVALAAMLGAAPAAMAQSSPLSSRIDARAKAIESKMIGWRRDFHEHPELGETEVRTAKIVADHLRSLGLEVKTGVAGTGVVALLQGGRPGPVVALRADMDALPVKEDTGLPFASKATGTFEGKTVPVMHACGHDTHVAILMAVAEILAGMKADLPGAVKFIFQPSEEGPSTFAPDGKRFWGGKLMVDQGVMENPKVDAIFGLHVFAGLEAGKLAWRSGPTMASADVLNITVNGRQTHGAAPWAGVDPIVVGSQVVLGLQTIASRQVEVTKEPSIITIGQFNGGVRSNIIPDQVKMAGTIRTFDDAMQEDIHQRIDRTARLIAESAGATAEVNIVKMYPTTINDPALTAMMEPTLKRVAGDHWGTSDKVTGAEDFSFFGRKAPALFLFLGATPKDKLAGAPANHSPKFFVDESGLIQGVRALANLTTDYMAMKAKP